MPFTRLFIVDWKLFLVILGSSAQGTLVGETTLATECVLEEQERDQTRS
jgi:hypothetical protein